MDPARDRYRNVGGAPPANGRLTPAAQAARDGRREWANRRKKMVRDYYHRVLCLSCGSGELRAVNASLARCTRCGYAIDHDCYESLLQIRALADMEGEHACDCGFASRCPSCG